MYRITSDDVVLWCDATADNGNAPVGQPNAPAISDVTPRWPKQEPISTALVGAANVIVHAICSPHIGRKTAPIQPPLNIATVPLGPGISLGELRLKGMEQLNLYNNFMRMMFVPIRF